MAYIGLIIGFVLLVKGADFFVDGASGIARRFNIPPLIIGLTIVAFGTSAPEAAVSITSALNGQTGMAIGNVVGSTIFNILVVVGISALIFPLKIDKTLVRKEIPFTILAGAMLLVLSLDTQLQLTEGHIISRADGLVLLGFFCIFMYSLVVSALRTKDEVEEGDDEVLPLGKSITFTLGGLVGVVFGGQVVVDTASTIASTWGMSDALIGLTIVAIGTSLPELVTSILAAKKGQSDIALGNVIGSNIFNILFVLGITSVISPLSMQAAELVDISIMLGVILMIFVMSVIGEKIGRIKGGILVIGYIAYTVYLIMGM